MTAINKMVLAIAFILVCIFLQSASTQMFQIPDTCPFIDEAQREEAILKCTADHSDLTELMKKIMGSQDQSQSSLLELESKVCQQTEAIEEAYRCLHNRLSDDCIRPGPDSDIMVAVRMNLPNAEKFQAALKHLCSNRGQFTQENIQCFQSRQNDITQCAREASQRRAQYFTFADFGTYLHFVCIVINETSACIEKYRESCNTDMMDTMVEVIDIMKDCDGTEIRTMEFEAVVDPIGSFFNRFSPMMSDTCPFLESTQRQTTALECVSTNPVVSATVQSLSRPNSSSLGLVDEMCKQTADFASVSACLVDKSKLCFPPFITGIPRQPFIDLLPNDERLKKALDHYCSNRDKLVINNLQCFQDPDIEDELTPCLNKDVQSKLADISPDDEDSVKDATCSAFYGANSCLKRYPGTCENNTVNAVTDLIKIFNPCNGVAQNGVTVLLLIATVLFSVFHKRSF